MKVSCFPIYTNLIQNVISYDKNHINIKAFDRDCREITEYVVYCDIFSYQKSYFTYLWADVFKGAVTAGALACQEILITGAREASKCTGAI